MTDNIYNTKGLLFVVGSIVLSAMAQLTMKAGALQYEITAVIADITILPALLWVIIGLTCYAISMLLWMAALARYELSYAYPLLSLSYVLVYIGAVLWPRLNESVSLMKTGGIILVILGVVLVTMKKELITLDSR